MNDQQEFIKLVGLYLNLVQTQGVDLRVIEAVIQMIMSYVPVNVEVRVEAMLNKKP